jgi:peptidoglycan/LPS O-acetylase OafA/YrhL
LRSSSGHYFIGLDHVRAVAAFFVFSWHFIHVSQGQFAGPPIFPFSILTEGHTGVALFMTLSGYLFAKLLNGKKILYGPFLLNRFIRLVPLLIVVLFVVGLEYVFIKGGNPAAFLQQITLGIVRPTLPNGGWSITAEFHFYLVLPLLLFLTHRWRYALVALLGLSIGFKAYLFFQMGEIQSLSYWTIIGRIDQFMLGILAFQFRGIFTKRHWLALLMAGGFATLYYLFDAMGGFYKAPSYPSPSALWIILPALEGLFYGALIAWYDTSFHQNPATETARNWGVKFSRFMALIGTYSYSIYLLHFFVVFRLARFVDNHIVDLSNIYLALGFSVFGFLLMVPLAHLSFRFIETPFLKFRSKYTKPQEDLMRPHDKPAMAAE